MFLLVRTPRPESGRGSGRITAKQLVLILKWARANRFSLMFIATLLLHWLLVAYRGTGR